MDKILILLILVNLSVTVNSQNLPQEKMKEIIESYKSNMESVKVIKDCGHVFDGFSYMVKQSENHWLDVSFTIKEQERKSMGKEIFKDITRAKKIVENHSAKNGVLKIITNITSNLTSKKVNYKLTILDSQEINAFTTMGGYIYLTTGLLDFVDSYDELAFIIGHEVAHEEKLHTQRKVTKLLFSSNILRLVKLEDFKKMALSINSSLSAPFDQIDEYEADKYGVFLAQKAGYNTNRFGYFFKKLEKYEKRDLLTKITSTHPFAKHRKKCISSYISK